MGWIKYVSHNCKIYFRSNVVLNRRSSARLRRRNELKERIGLNGYELCFLKIIIDLISVVADLIILSALGTFS
jgi:hypothetical protein